MNEQQPDEHDLPALDHLIGTAVKKFWSKRSFSSKGGDEPYTMFEAAYEAIEEHQGDKFELLRLLRNQIALEPQDIESSAFDHIVEAKSWDNMWIQLCQVIIVCEIEARFPDVMVEEFQRNDQFG